MSKDTIISGGTDQKIEDPTLLHYTPDHNHTQFIRISFKVHDGRFFKVLGPLLDDLTQTRDKSQGRLPLATPYLIEYLPSDLDPKADIKAAIRDWEERTNRTLLPKD